MKNRNTPFSIAEQDSSPTVWNPWQIQFPNGTVTNNGNGTVFINSGASGSGEILEARTPLLKAGTILSLNTDGTTTNFLRGDGTWSVPAGGEILEARTPLLKSGTILSVLTDGSINYLRGDGTYRSPFEVRSPLISSGTVISITTDGSTTTFQRGDGSLAIPSSNGGVKLIVFTVYSSTTWTAENIPIFQTPFETPITIKQVNAAVSGGGSPQLGFNIEQRAWGGLGISGTNLFANIQSANTTGFQSVSFTSANIAAKAHLILASSAVIAGNVDYITGAIYYTRDSI